MVVAGSNHLDGYFGIILALLSKTWIKRFEIEMVICTNF